MEVSEAMLALYFIDAQLDLRVKLILVVVQDVRMYASAFDPGACGCTRRALDPVQILYNFLHLISTLRDCRTVESCGHTDVRATQVVLQ